MGADSCYYAVFEGDKVRQEQQERVAKELRANGSTESDSIDKTSPEHIEHIPTIE